MTAPVPPSLRLLMLIQFASGGALYNYLTLFLREGGLERPTISLVYLAGAATSSVFPFVWGWVADRHLGLDRLIPLLHLVAGCALAVLATRTGFVSVLICYTLYVAFQQPTISLTHALCYHNLHDPPNQFGALRLWGSLGWVLPVFPVWLWHVATRTESMAIAVHMTIGLHLLLVLSCPLLPRTPPPGRRPAPPSGVDGEVPPVGIRAARFWDDLRRLFSIPGFARLLGIGFLTHSAFTIMFFYSNLRLQEVGVPLPAVGIVLAAGVLGEIPLFLLLRPVLATLGFPRTLALGVIASMVRQLAFSLAESPVLLVAASLLVAPCVVFYWIAASLAVDAIAPREVRATAQSILTLVGSGLGTMFGLTATWWLTRSLATGMRGPFLFAAVTSALALILLGSLRISSPAGGGSSCTPGTDAPGS